MATSSKRFKVAPMAPPGPGATASEATTIFSIHPEILQTHILPRLDALALAAASATSSQLRDMCSHEPLWANLSHSTWPSTNDPRLRHVISTFPNGYRSFFSYCFPRSSISPRHHHRYRSLANLERTNEWILAIDLFHVDNLIFSTVIETGTGGSFPSKPIRVESIDPNCKGNIDDIIHGPPNKLKPSCILINPARRRAENLQSSRRVVDPSWTRESGESRVRFVFKGAAATVFCSLVCEWETGDWKLKLKHE
ncbi:hypothetical protein RIF29_24280 [Crotalaria pallida]|uniref:F-box domain-containing protein n=1 Tax=Crotalaria pallida TaxID=3830 RepID=A0AAN9HWF4_CROPI